MQDNELLGKIGRTISRVTSEFGGEVMLPIRGGSEAFFAKALTTIEPNQRVEVIEYYPPRGVLVKLSEENRGN